MSTPAKGANACPNGIQSQTSEHFSAKSKPMTDKNGKPVIGKDGKPVMVTITSSNTVTICKANPDDKNKKTAGSDSKFTISDPKRQLSALKSGGKPAVKKHSPAAEAKLKDARKFGMISVLKDPAISKPQRAFGQPTKAAGPAKK